MIVGVATPSPLRRRLERVLSAEADVRVVDLDAARHVDVAAIHGALPTHVVADLVVALPLDPVAELADWLAAEAVAVAGTTAPDEVALTRPGVPLDGGAGVTFPPPLGAQWAEPEGSRLVAPVEGDLAGIVVSAGTVRLGVVDEHDFLAAIGLAAPVVAAIRRVDLLAAARAAGLGVAAFEAA